MPPSTEPLMPYEEYKALAKAAAKAAGIQDMEDGAQLDKATSLLSDFGDLLYFPFVAGMEDVVVLRPQWLADVMAQVVTVDGLKKDKLLLGSGEDGRVSKAALVKLMEAFSPRHAAGLINLLERFSLLHSIDSDTVLVPPLLLRASSAEGVKRLHKESGLAANGTGWRWWHAQYAYSYVPEALLCRAMCRLFALPSVEVLEAWRFGAVLRRNGHLACIAQGPVGHNAVAVTVCGTRPDVLGALISSKLSELLAEAFVGVQLEDIHYGCSSCVQSGKKRPGLINTRAPLRRALKLGTKVITPTCEVCDEYVDVEELARRDDQAQQLMRALVKEVAAAQAQQQLRGFVEAHAADEAQQLLRALVKAATADEMQQPMRKLVEAGDVDEAQQLMSDLVKADAAARMGQGTAAAYGALMPMLVEIRGKLDKQEASMASLSVQVGSVLISKMDGVKLLSLNIGANLQAVLDMHVAADAEAHADVVRRVLALHKGVSMLDAKRMPTLHVILPEPSKTAWWDVKGLVEARFRLHLLCEHPGGPHMTDHGGYVIERTKPFLRKHARGLSILSHAAGLLLGAGVRAMTGGASDGGLKWLGQFVDEHVLAEPMQAFTRLNELFDKLQLEEDEQQLRPLVAPPAGGAAAGSTMAWQAKHKVEFEGCQEAQREIQVLIQQKDPMRTYGNLQKVSALSGDVLWLCKEHAACHPGAFNLR
ncbi:putative serine/threonine-protein kinase [Tetrabaena socialis]|uniref:Putative serine/threonine-protein kinase n=1 Tax=Tetrabaena socialis TaxID=47790 RepID=A0A2J7ZPW2_9CHLO|nr:putative serine/threonine-protein kinase [Tetrabaena socialis]|eukprot:PNH02307.1 putative serine/threonine-protein kinase [Tetrabaena socialis]